MITDNKLHNNCNSIEEKGCLTANNIKCHLNKMPTHSSFTVFLTSTHSFKEFSFIAILHMNNFFSIINLWSKFWTNEISWRIDMVCPITVARFVVITSAGNVDADVADGNGAATLRRLWPGETDRAMPVAVNITLFCESVILANN